MKASQAQPFTASVPPSPIGQRKPRTFPRRLPTRRWHTSCPIRLKLPIAAPTSSTSDAASWRYGRSIWTRCIRRTVRTPPPRRPRISRFALPPDKVMQAGSGDSGGLAELPRLVFTGRHQLVELGSADAVHAGRVVDANDKRTRGASLLNDAPT